MNIQNELKKLGISNTQELLFYFPYRYEDFSNVVKISDIHEGDQISIKAVVKDIKALNGFYGRVARAEAVISDDTGSLKAVWFNQPYIAKYISKGDEVFLAGRVRFYKTLQLQNPIYEKISAYFDEQIHTARIIPVYKLAGNLSLRTLRGEMYRALDQLPLIKEYLPAKMVAELGLMDIQTMVKNAHFPDSLELLEQAKRRLAFEEIFYAQLAIQKHKNEIEKEKARAIPFNRELVQEFIADLPFELTVDQKKALWEILQDMQHELPMNRLLEGDVGSGKTMVAFISALEALKNGLQVAMLCPTEILAQQHYNNAIKYFKKHPQISLMLLTSKKALVNGKPTTKNNLIAEIGHGGPQFIISTHAVLQKNVDFSELALVIIDEQHRFGVRQRAALKRKHKDLHPHLLSMTATPIPRTLKLALFGDLQISQIINGPAGRKTTVTKLVQPDARNLAYEFIAKQIEQGRQAFVVTPLIEESDKLGVKAATAEVENLKKVFPKFNVGLLHGKMKAADKEQIMQDFLAQKIDILVSTSVIEVGVDVPNASVMVIEGADRFGLAQLHQFRGRVGRAEHQSYCFLFTDNINEKTLERLDLFTKTNNGFELAEIDLKNRGFGNIFGEEQSGFYYFKYFSLQFDQDLIKKAQTWAEKILAEDPKLKEHPEMLSKIEDKVIHLE